MSTPELELTSEQIEHLRHEKFVAGILEIRSPARPGSRPFLKEFLLSGSGAALITVIIGAILGNWLASLIQERAKDSNYLRQRQANISDMKLESYRANLAARIQTTEEAIQLLGKVVFRAESHMLAKGSDFATVGLSTEQANDLETQKQQIMKDYNSAQEEWRSRASSFSYLLSYYHNDKAVAEAWNKLAAVVEEYMDCTESITGGTLRDDSCSETQNNVSTKLTDLKDVIINVRNTEWKKIEGEME